MAEANKTDVRRLVDEVSNGGHLELIAEPLGVPAAPPPRSADRGIADGLAGGARLAGGPWLMTPADAGRL